MIVLASQSAARRAMLTAAGVAHDAVPAHIDEAEVTAGLVAAGASPEQIADALAELKAIKISRGLPGVLVLGADSVVVADDGSLIDKAHSRGEAMAQLQRLSGTTHRLVSAAVIARDGVAVWRAGGAVRLTMRGLSDAFIADYLAAEGDDLLGCVGCYRIEGRGAQLFTRVDGDQFTVRGLPLLAVLDYLRVVGELPA
jgi:septum formation protein